MNLNQSMRIFMTDSATKIEGNKGTYALTIDSTRHDRWQPHALHTPQSWEFSRSGEIVSRPPESSYTLDDNRKRPEEIKPIPCINIASKDFFEDVLQKRLPVVMKDIDLGPCRNKWTLTYLTEQIGKDRKVRQIP